jgi:aspartate 1-decarboxylase
MLLQLLRVKIQQLIVTESSESYPGSIALPDELLEASGLKLFEQVHINNLTNGNRIITYVVKSNKPGYVSLNGAASKLFNKGDKIHVLAFGYFNDEEEALGFEPTIVYADEENKLIEAKNYTF